MAPPNLRRMVTHFEAHPTTSVCGGHDWFAVLCNLRPSSLRPSHRSGLRALHRAPILFIAQDVTTRICVSLLADEVYGPVPRHSPRPLRDLGADWPRRNGRGLRRARHATGSHRCDQDSSVGRSRWIEIGEGSRSRIAAMTIAGFLPSK